MLLNRDSGRVVVADVTKIIHMSSAVNNMVIPDSGYASCHPHNSKSELCVYILRSSMSKSSNHDLSAKKHFFWKVQKKSNSTISQLLHKKKIAQSKQYQENG